MKVSIEWLTDYINITKNAEELINELKLHTTDVESYSKVGENLSNVVVGKIKDVKPHKNSDNLVVCEIDVGNSIKKIVTGDLTVKAEEKVPVALPGAILANDVKIETRDFKGIVSEGMMCSLKELGISEDADKIYRIIDDVETGADFVKYFNLADEILEIDILPNRPDLLSYLGIAKELEAIDCGKNFTLFDYTQIQKGEGFPVKIEYDKCKRYMATVMKNIKVGPSPLWLVKRLGRAGIRSINNIVDITNYVMLETGHPIHAFDLDLIGNQIVVRKANNGEKVLLLDEKEYTLRGDETLITDGKNIIALGGIMGGELSGINENTTSVLLEVAYFDPVNIRKSSSYHKISSDSSYRFERGVDPNDSEIVMGRLIKLTTELATGEVEGFTTDVYPNTIEKKRILLRKNYLNSRLGKVIEKSDVEKIFNKLDFTFVNQGENWLVSIPTKRPDIIDEVDIVEEVGRVYGYSKIPSYFPSISGLTGAKGDFVAFKDRVTDIMLANGFHEAKTFPLNNIKRMWMEDDVELKVVNPLSSEYEYITPKLVYGLLEATSFNYRNQNRDVKLFEIDKVFLKDDSSETGAKEFTNLAFVATGRENEYDFTDKREISFYTLKGTLENVFKEWSLNVDFLRSSQIGLMKSQSAELFFNDLKIGFLGLLDPQIADSFYEIKSPVYICEINLDTLFANRKDVSKKIRKFDFPAIKREYAFVVPISVEFKEIQKVIEDGGDIIEEFQIFDVYKGKNLPKDKISITVSIVYRSEYKTLKDEEVNEVEKNILSKLQKLNVKLRER